MSERVCTCHPNDGPPKPCQRKYALSDCKRSEADFRAVGYTATAIDFPLSDAAVEWLCRFNGAPAEWTPPRGWHYAPNAAVQAMLEKKAMSESAMQELVDIAQKHDMGYGEVCSGSSVDRAPVSETEGRAFDPRPEHHKGRPTHD